MTGNDLFAQALGMVGERANDSDLTCFAVGWINQLLAEALDVENSVLKFEGEESFEHALVLSAPGDEIPYSDRIVRYALPDGLAAFLYEVSDDLNMAADYRARYVAALRECAKLIPADVADCY